MIDTDDLTDVGEQHSVVTNITNNNEQHSTVATALNTGEQYIGVPSLSNIREQHSVVATFPNSSTIEQAGRVATVLGASEEHGDEATHLGTSEQHSDVTRHPNTGELHDSVMTDSRSTCLVDNMAGILEGVKDIHDPVAVLRYYQRRVMSGRQLDQTSLTEPLDGETQPIYVSRLNIFETGMEEILEAPNLLVPLEVTFYGEEAADLGGPRKEFLALMIQELIKEEWRLFEKVDDNGYTLKEDSGGLERKYYFGAGLVCGLSLMQNGPLPRFLKDEELETPLSEVVKPIQAQFRDGLNRLGFVDLMRRKPCIKFLFRPSARSALTERKLIHLLKPAFSYIGSNRRSKEDVIYQKFLTYIKEVSGEYIKSVKITRKRNGVEFLHLHHDHNKTSFLNIIMQ